ncbi:hypothetical protein EPUL_006812, partial [Erysiphe pulchra]
TKGPPVHLPDEHLVFFRQDATLDSVGEAAERATSELLAFFKSNRSSELGKRLLYQDYPKFFVYDKKTKPHSWKERKRGTAIGRLIFLNPCHGDVYYLRLLLTKIRGPTSYEDLYTHNGVRYLTFKEACAARNFLENDGEWDDCFAEASEFAIGGLRKLFVLALTDGNVRSPIELWEKFQSAICEDCEYRLRAEFGDSFVSTQNVQDYGLYQFQKELQLFGKKLEDFGLPLPIGNWEPNHLQSIPLARQYNEEEQTRLLREFLPQLNDDQRRAYEQITRAIENDSNTAHFFL